MTDLLQCQISAYGAMKHVTWQKWVWRKYFKTPHLSHNSFTVVCFSETRQKYSLVWSQKDSIWLSSVPRTEGVSAHICQNSLYVQTHFLQACLPTASNTRWKKAFQCEQQTFHLMNCKWCYKAVDMALVFVSFLSSFASTFHSLFLSHLFLSLILLPLP